MTPGWRGRLLEAALDGAGALIAQLARERPSGTGGGSAMAEPRPARAASRIPRPHFGGAARAPGEPSAAVVPPSVGTSWAFREHRTCAQAAAALAGSIMAGPPPKRRVVPADPGAWLLR